MGEGAGALVDEHREAIGVGDAECFGLGEELRLRRVVDHVENASGAGKLGEVGGRSVSVAKAGGRGVDDNSAGG